MDSLAQLSQGKLAGSASLALKNAKLSSLPLELASLASTLEHLDCSDNPQLTSLPSAAHFPWHTFTKLKRVFFASCGFTAFPAELALCPALEMVGFRSNGMSSIAEGALPPRLRWLILTGNELTTLPEDVGRCARLEKCMLAGNRIDRLPASMSACTNLTLLRLACNNLTQIPDWLLAMPNLAFLALAGNPCARPIDASNLAVPAILSSTLTLGEKLGEGASGIIAKSDWNGVEVAVKMFRSSLITSDGSPKDEMMAALLAGAHPSLVSALARVVAPSTGEAEAEEETVGIIMSLLPPSFNILGLPPTFDSCTRDAYPASARLTPPQALAILRGVASALEHIHAKGLSHGDLYAHNIAFDAERNEVVLGDFGAACAYEREGSLAGKIERLEVRAFGFLVEDVLGLLEGDEELRAKLTGLRAECLRAEVGDRPAFAEIVDRLS